MDFFHERCGGFAGDERQKAKGSATLFHRLPFFRGNGFDREIATFYIDVGFCQLQKVSGTKIVKNVNARHGLQGCQNGCAVLVGIDWTSRPLQLSNPFVGRHPDKQGIAEISSAFEVGDVPKVEKVETAVGDDELFPLSTEFVSP